MSACDLILCVPALILPLCDSEIVVVDVLLEGTASIVAAARGWVLLQTWRHPLQLVFVPMDVSAQLPTMLMRLFAKQIVLLVVVVS